MCQHGSDNLGGQSGLARGLDCAEVEITDNDLRAVLGKHGDQMAPGLPAPWTPRRC
jgi:hypothetical protein